MTDQYCDESPDGSQHALASGQSFHLLSAPLQDGIGSATGTEPLVQSSGGSGTITNRALAVCSRMLRLLINVTMVGSSMEPRGARLLPTWLGSHAWEVELLPLNYNCNIVEL